VHHHRPFVAVIQIVGATLVMSLAALSALLAQAPAPQASPAVLAPNPAGPMYQQKGEQYRVYSFPGTGESIPYRLFVPSRWTSAAKLPLLVTLRAGNTVDGPYRAGNDLVKQAEQRGYLVVTPLGYRGLSQPYYGSPYPIVRPNGPSVPAAGWTAVENERAEQDVMNVIRLVQAEYNADPARTYIHGQNPSASGALHLAAKYPDVFAAVVVSSGPIPPDVYPFASIKGKMGLLVIHGDQDTTNPIVASQRLAEAAKAAGVSTEYATVPGGTHLEAYLTYAGAIFDFLEKHRK
jgi:poly(3-hydroxybutyrate) depolymerase